MKYTENNANVKENKRKQSTSNTNCATKTVITAIKFYVAFFRVKEASLHKKLFISFLVGLKKASL